MKDIRKLVTGVPAIALVLCLVATYMTRGAMQHLPFLNRNGQPRNGDLVDQSPWQTVWALAPLAVSAEEKALVTEAERLADHEVDQAFAMALRQATIAPRTYNAKAQALQKRVTQLQQTVKEDSAKVDALTPKAGSGPVATATAGNDLDLAKAQLGLDKDELADAAQDLNRESGDQRGKVQQELATREASMKKYDSQTGGDAQPALMSETQRRTLYHRLSAWVAQQNRQRLIVQAQQEAQDAVVTLTSQHNRLEAAADAEEAKGPDQSITGAARVKAIESMAARRHIMSILDDRIQTQGQLATVYGRWIQQIQLQRKMVVHLMFRSFTWIALIVFCTMLVGWTLRQVLDRISKNRRQQRKLRAILDLGTQMVGLILILLVIFGTPRQITTILGLLTAGLTVVFQDFILAFFGWFILIGKRGLRIGDWVEINGVGGEVLEIGLFHTSLLETGNWAASGHPTGRRTTFLNSFAIRGQYFNFSTTGQWMWDELKVHIPSDAQTYDLIDRIHAAVVKATEADTTAAQEEWQRMTQSNGLIHFTAEPSVELRPAPSGIELVVRYVTRAGGGLEMRNRLYQEVIDLLQPKPAELTASGRDTRY